ncbi:hypothetical protein CL655_00185 [bacterium]|nr:hypothetical protein [bacterium]|tara:strand:+ start:75 stop:689 length:615 start_codon:yes stop_codon:yes gene_type:complete
MEKKGQVVFIHGGDSYNNDQAFYEHLRIQEYEPHPESYKRWRDWLQVELEAAGYEWLFMAMPNKQNADYEAWKIWFEKVVPFIEVDNDTHVIGYSLGACFLLRYLSENESPFHISKLHLIALALPTDSESIGSFGVDTKIIDRIEARAEVINLYHSKNDTICPYADSEKVAAVISGAKLHTFTDRGHFLQPEFPELLAEIQKIT